MRVVAFNGSPRKQGNTYKLINAVFEELHKHDIETELVQIGGKPVRGCLACGHCSKVRDGTCVIKDDIINDCIAKMNAADGIILGSPTYYTDVTAEMKGLIDRAGLVTGANGNTLRHKVGAAVVAVRRAGSLHVFDTLNHFFLIKEMIVPGSTYWNMGFGLDQDDVVEDAEGLRTMRVLGQNMAWLLEKLNSSSGE